MLQLIINENMKIYRRVRTWVLIAVVFLATVGVAAALKFGMTLQGDDWKSAVRQEIRSLEEQLHSPGVPSMAKVEQEHALAVKRYSLEHDITPYWEPVINSSVCCKSSPFLW